MQRGEVFALLGTNGAGKTTTLDVLEGYREATAGVATVFGLDPIADRDKLAPRIGIMLQDAGFFETLTVRQTVTAWRRFYRRPRSLEETVSLVGLAHRVDVRVSALSGGERRRLDLALALLGHPELLFLDEPTTGMDPEGRHQSLELVAALVREGMTVVLTTHYLQEAEQLADRVAIMHRGTIRRLGTLEEVRSEAGAARVGFDLPAELAHRALSLPVGLRAVIGERHDGAHVEIRSDDPEHTLRRLLPWAQAERLPLKNLEVRRGGLEDVFLNLAEEPDADDRMPSASDQGSGAGRGAPRHHHTDTDHADTEHIDTDHRSHRDHPVADDERRARDERDATVASLTTTGS